MNQQRVAGNEALVETTALNNATDLVDLFQSGDVSRIQAYLDGKMIDGNKIKGNTISVNKQLGPLGEGNEAAGKNLSFNAYDKKLVMTPDGVHSYLLNSPRKIETLISKILKGQPGSYSNEDIIMNEVRKLLGIGQGNPLLPVTKE